MFLVITFGKEFGRMFQIAVWEMRPSSLTYSLAEADSHRKSVEEDGGGYGMELTYVRDMILPGAK